AKADRSEWAEAARTGQTPATAVAPVPRRERVAPPQQDLTDIEPIEPIDSRRLEAVEARLSVPAQVRVQPPPPPRSRDKDWDSQPPPVPTLPPPLIPKQNLPVNRSAGRTFLLFGGGILAGVLLGVLGMFLGTQILEATAKGAKGSETAEKKREQEGKKDAD